MMGRVVTAAVLVAVAVVAAAALACAAPERQDGRAPSAEARRSDQAAYTQAFVQRAIDRYEADGLEDTLAHYRSVESFDGQYYVFIADEGGTLIAHPSPEVDFQGVHLSEVRTTNEYPSGQMVLDAASEDGVWVRYESLNPSNGRMQMKHAWLITHDGLLFGSGWHEDLPRKSNHEAYTQWLVEKALILYDAPGFDVTIDYYNSRENVDGPWYVFIIDASTGRTVGHFRPEIRQRDPSERIDSTGYFYGDDLLSAGEEGKWIQIRFLNPETGEDEVKHVWAIHHDGYVFGSGWYE